MSLETLLHSLRLDPAFLRNVTTWRRLSAEPACTVPFPDDLDPRLAATLRQRGIDCLYTHQASAWQVARQGRHFVAVTPTASGKTLCYNLPILQTLLADPVARALYLFPTKALAQDQLAELLRLQENLREAPYPWRPATYDGDTPPRQRPAIRQHSRIILTNPDMLHVGILPNHPRWADFFANLRFVVIDELHTYRGVFGSHVANVLRRLRRICRFHSRTSPGVVSQRGSPQFLCASATIANPRELAERLVEAPVALVDDDGSPKGERHIIFYNPPLVDRELGLRRSSTLEAEALAARLAIAGVQTVVFARSRLTVEVLLTYLRKRVQRLEARGREAEVGEGRTGETIRGYRGGYLPGERRAIERGLRDGSVRAVVATNALELGVDIGGLEAAVLTGFPGTIASTWQQAGRAGRRNSVSLAILVATAGALDQYIINHPQYFFERSPEHALVNPDNLVILSNHIACAAFELPFTADERFGNVPFTREVLTYLAETGEVQQHAGDWFWMGEGSPAQSISLRTASPDNVVIHAPRLANGQRPGGHDRGKAADVTEEDAIGDSQYAVIGELEREAVPLLLYPGAVYLHEGQSYLVERLDWEDGQAWVRAADVDYYTQASSSQQVHVLDVHEQALSRGVVKAHGPVQVISRTSVFRKVKLHTHETLGYGEIDLPEQVLETQAYWMSFTEDLLEPLRLTGQWRSDPNDYGPNWSQQRDAARDRDDYRCTVCGIPESGGRQHDVHHKMPFRSFGYVPGLNENYRQANELDNLVTLCRSCHQRVEQGQRLRTGLGGLAYVLGNIAPLHLMCDSRDIGVVSEWQAASSRPHEASSSGAPRRMASGADREQGGSGGQQAAVWPTITIYERVPAGIGFSLRLFELHDTLLQAAHDVVCRCACPSGCPACVGPTTEAVETDIDAKALTLALLEKCRVDRPGA